MGLPWKQQSFDLHFFALFFGKLVSCLLFSRDGHAHATCGIPWTLIKIENVGKHADVRLILKDVQYIGHMICLLWTSVFHAH